MKARPTMRIPASIVFSAVISCGMLAGAEAQTAAQRGRAPTLVSPKLSATAPTHDGFIQRWLVLEPVRTKGQLTESAVQAAVKTDIFADPLTVLPRDGDTVTVDGSQLAWHALDTTEYNVNLYHFAYALGKPTSNVLFWAVTVVNSPREIADVRLAIGSNAASVWWVNGKEVIAIYNDRQTVIDDGVSKRLTLQKGSNIVRAAIVNAGGATDFCARFVDAEYRPIRDVSVTLTNR
jgi:hypothetical protein